VFEFFEPIVAAAACLEPNIETLGYDHSAPDSPIGTINWEHILFMLQQYGDELLQDNLNAIRVGIWSSRYCIDLELCSVVFRFAMTCLIFG
jgi:hypothetical protein